MEVIFTNPDLEELYTTGFSRKYKKVPAEIVQKLPRAVGVLKSVRIIQDIWSFPGYKFERLESFTNRYSMRLGRKWRLEMIINWDDETCTVGLIALDDLTPHYGD